MDYAKNLRASSVALVFSILVFPQTSTATTIVTTSAQVFGTHIVGSLDNDQATGAAGQASQTSSGAGSSVTVLSGTPPFPVLGTQVGGATASGSAFEGALHAFSSANSMTAGSVQNSATGTSSTSAGWSDSVIFNAGSGLLNQSGFVRASVNVSGGLGGSQGGPIGDAVLPDASMISVFVQVFGTGMAGDPACLGPAYCAELSSHSGNIFGGPQISFNAIPGVITLNIPVVFGIEVTLGYHLEVRAQAVTFTGGGVGTSASGVADFSSSLLWGGITGVFDANGDAVDNFTTASASGFDYGQAAQPAVVPEPITLSLLAAGLGGMAWLRRRTRLTPRILQGKDEG